MDNEEITGVKFSEFPSATPGDSDEVVGLHSGDNARFSVANFILAIRQGLASIFVPKTDVGAANGVASLDSTGKVPSPQLPPIASTAADVTFDNTASGLTATDVQAAIDEVVDDVWTRVPVYGMGKNLLDNWYFLNPVNQRGQLVYSTADYTVDRWKLTSGSLTVTSSGITLNGTIVQILESSIGLDTVCSALCSDGTMLTPTYNDSTKTFSLTASGETIVAAKLEVGTEHTLAHQENGAWVLNEIPDYGEELRKCQRYLWCGKPSSYFTGNYTWAISTDACDFMLYLPQEMSSDVTSATVIGTEPRIYNSANVRLTGYTLTASIYKNLLALTAEKTGGFTVGGLYRLLMNQNSLFGVSLEP